MGAQVPGELDGDGAHPAGTGMDEDLLAGFQLRDLDQCLPGREADQGNRRGLRHAQVARLGGHIVFADGDELGEGADALLIGAGIHGVAGLEAAHARADAHDRAGHVVAEDQGQAVAEDRLQRAGADPDVQHVDAGRVDLHQNVIVAQCGLRHVGDLADFVLAVTMDDEGFHVEGACWSGG